MSQWKETVSHQDIVTQTLILTNSILLLVTMTNTVQCTGVNARREVKCWSPYCRETVKSVLASLLQAGQKVCKCPGLISIGYVTARLRLNPANHLHYV